MRNNVRKIPIKLRNEMSVDPFYKRCCVTGSMGEKIEFHHNLIFASRQINEKWCILPLAKSVHDDIFKNQDVCDWIMLNRATTKELVKYSKAIDYVHRREQLNQKYGQYIPKI